MLTANSLFAQTGSLLNKKLVRLDDLSSVVESGIGSLLGGRVQGTLDSVVVTKDSERELQVKLWYRGYDQGLVKLVATDRQKQRQKSIQGEEISLGGRSGPLVCMLQLDPALPGGQELESPFLRIEITKEAGRPGQVFNYVLNKRWKTDLDPENVVVNVRPVPVGSAALLKETEVKDVVPQKTILFKADKLYYNPKLEEKIKARESLQRVDKAPIINGGGKSLQHLFAPGLLHRLRQFHGLAPLSDDISGTWVNTDANTNSITKLVITGNNQLQVFGKCSPTDCDWGKTPMQDKGNNSFGAVYKMGFKTSTISLSYANAALTLTAADVFNNARGTRTYSHTFKKNAPLLLMVSPIFTLKDYAAAAPAAANNRPSAPVDLTPKGPANRPLYLWADLKADIDIERPQDISNINMNIFPDKNEAAGVFYFIPADYHLRYKTKPEAEKGFDLNIQYGTRSADNIAPVRMSASLTAGMSSREMSFIKTLLRANLSTSRELRVLPLPLREKPVFSFQTALTSQYNIPQEKVMVESSTDLSNDMRVAWQTDADTKEFIQSALLAREGLAASVVLKPQDEAIIDQQIPVTINLADNRTLGKITLDPISWRTQAWRNTLPYPLQLRYLNILKVSPSAKAPVIYSWSLGDAVVAPKAQVAFDPALVPAWLDNQESVMMWIDYNVMDCRPCDQKVIDAVTGGVSGNRSQMVKFIIPPAVFDSLGASYFLVTVRSRQLDPNGEVVKELPALKITKDESKEYAAGPFYLPTDGTLSFEYRMRMATADGEFREASEWFMASEKEMLLGKTRMRQIFPSQSNRP